MSVSVSISMPFVSSQAQIAIPFLMITGTFQSKRCALTVFKYDLCEYYSGDSRCFTERGYSFIYIFV